MPIALDHSYKFMKKYGFHSRVDNSMQLKEWLFLSIQPINKCI